MISEGLNFGNSRFQGAGLEHKGILQMLLCFAYHFTYIFSALSIDFDFDFEGRWQKVFRSSGCVHATKLLSVRDSLH